MKKLDRTPDLQLTDQKTQVFGLLRTKKHNIDEAGLDPFDLLLDE